MTSIRTATLAAGLVAALTVAACGGASTPAPTVVPTAAASPLASLPASSVPASQAAAASPASGGSAFGAAADKLDALASYRFTVDIDSASANRTQKVMMNGTVVNSPTKAYALDMDNSGDRTSVVVIGSDAWIKLGAAPWHELSESMAQTFVAGLAVFRPEKLFATAFGMNGDKFTSTGDESRNGVTSVHYKGSDALSAIYGSMFGVRATYASDVWVAKGAGYLVASEIRTSGASSSVAGSYISIVNVTNADDPANKVDRPA